MSVIELDLSGRKPPSGHVASLDAELNVIGAVLCDNRLMDKVQWLEPRHFFDPVHARAWVNIQAMIAERHEADIVTLAAKLQNDEGLRTLGGASWLADLVDHARTHPQIVREHAALITEMAHRREVSAIASEAVAAISKGEESAVVVRELEGALLALQAHDRRTGLVSASAAAAEVISYLDGTEADAGGILTGIGPLDEALGPLLPDDLVLLAGRPGAGKSALGGCIALNIARSGVGVIEINCEMSTAQMMRRHLTDLAFERWGPDAPTYKDIRRRRITAGQREMLRGVAEQIRELPLAMAKRTGLGMAALRSAVRLQTAVWAEQGIALGAVTIDHVGLLTADGGGRDRYQDQTSIAIAMKALADELHIPVIALVQLSRKVEDRDCKKPMLSDLRDSGAWEENADIVIGIYRDAYYAKKEPDPKATVRGRDSADLAWSELDRRRRSPIIEAGIIKVREGEEGTVNLWASIGHNAIRGANPQGGEGFFS